MRKKVCGLGTILLLALAYVMDTENVFPYFVAATILHEMGHVIAVAACGGRIRSFTLAPFGFCLRFDGMMSYWCDAAIAAGGAAMNLCAAFLLSVAAKYLPWTGTSYLDFLTFFRHCRLTEGAFYMRFWHRYWMTGARLSPRVPHLS